MAAEPDVPVLEYAREESPHQINRRILQLFCIGTLFAIPLFFFWRGFFLLVRWFLHTYGILTKSLTVSPLTMFLVYDLEFRQCAFHMSAISGLTFLLFALKQCNPARSAAQVLSLVLSVVLFVFICLWFTNFPQLALRYPTGALNEYSLILWTIVGCWSAALFSSLLYCRFPIRILPILFTMVPFVFVMVFVRSQTLKPLFEELGYRRGLIPFNSVMEFVSITMCVGLLILSNLRIKFLFGSKTASWLVSTLALAFTEFWIMYILSPLTFGVSSIRLKNYREMNWLIYLLFISVEVYLGYRIWRLVSTRLRMESAL